MHLIGRHRQISEFEASLLYRASYRSTKAITQKNPIFEKKKTKTKTRDRREIKSIQQGMEKWLGDSRGPRLDFPEPTWMLPIVANSSPTRPKTLPRYPQVPGINMADIQAGKALIEIQCKRTRTKQK